MIYAFSSLLSTFIITRIINQYKHLIIILIYQSSLALTAYST